MNIKTVVSIGLLSASLAFGTSNVTLGGITYPVNIVASTPSHVWAVSLSNGVGDPNTSKLCRVNQTATKVIDCKKFPNYRIVNVAVGFPLTNLDTLWVLGTNLDGSADLIEMDGDTGVTLQTYSQVSPSGSLPFDMVTDGSDIWIGNFPNQTLTKFSTMTRAIVGIFPVGIDAISLTTDHKGHVWTTGHTGVVGVNTVDGTIYRSFDFGFSRDLQSIAWDSVNLWVVDYLQNEVLQVNPDTGMIGAVVDRLQLGDNGWHASEVASDGKYIWVSTYQQVLLQCHVNDATTAMAFTVGVGSGMPLIDRYPDGSESIWVPNFYTNDINRIAGH